MSALSKIYQETIPSSIVIDYISLYTEIGKEEVYKEKLSSSSKILMESTLKNDIISAFRLFFSDLKITDTRLNQIINSKIEPKDNADIIAFNLTNIFKEIRTGTLKIDEMEIYHLSRILYRGYMKDNNYNQYKRSTSSLDTQSKLQEIMNNYKDHYQKGDIETITLNTAFLIDFLKLSPFKAGNYAIGFIYFYALNITQNINCFKYNSFFEYIKNNYNELESAINSAFYQYEDDLSNPSKLIRFMLKACKESFIKLHSDISINDFDKKSSKAILIKRAILSFKESFTKEDIRNKVLGASDSTIERVLKELQSENIIMTTGTGRSAKWVIIKSDFNPENQNIDFSL